MAHGDGGGDMGFVATIDATGESAGIFQVPDLDFWDLQIGSPYGGHTMVYFGTPDSSEITVATLRDGKGEIRESLILEVVTTNR